MQRITRLTPNTPPPRRSVRERDFAIVKKLFSITGAINVSNARKFVRERTSNAIKIFHSSIAFSLRESNIINKSRFVVSLNRARAESDFA